MARSNIGEYHRALKAGDYSALEGLAEMAGYKESFDPFYTNLMGTRIRGFENGFDDADARNDILMAAFTSGREAHDIQLHPIRGYLRYMFGSGSDGNGDGQAEGADVYVPREYWRKNYADRFTRLRRTGSGVSFVDCWEPTGAPEGKSRLALMKGRYANRWYGPGNDDLNGMFSEGDIMTLDMARLRERHPPSSALGLLVGPDIDWAVLRTLGSAALKSIGYYGIGQAANSDKAGLVAGLGLSLGLQVWSCIHNSKALGNGFYKRRGIKLGDKAVDALFEEARP